LISILKSGCGYVSTTKGNLIATLDLNRAVLILSKPIKHRRLKSKRKEVNRVLKNLLKNQSISFKINTNFKLTMDKLKEHHKQSWFGEKCEKLWK